MWAETHKVPLIPLCNPIPVYNMDGTRNSARSIMHSMELAVEFQGHREKVTAEVTDLGRTLSFQASHGLNATIRKLTGQRHGQDDMLPTTL